MALTPIEADTLILDLKTKIKQMGIVCTDAHINAYVTKRLDEMLTNELRNKLPLSPLDLITIQTLSNPLTRDTFLKEASDRERKEESKTGEAETPSRHTPRRGRPKTVGKRPLQMPQSL